MFLRMLEAGRPILDQKGRIKQASFLILICFVPAMRRFYLINCGPFGNGSGMVVRLRQRAPHKAVSDAAIPLGNGSHFVAPAYLFCSGLTLYWRDSSHF